MAEIQIKAIPRQPGKGLTRSMRSSKLVPSVVYGPKVENAYFYITELDAARYSTKSFENSIFTLKSEDKKIDGMRVLKKEVAVHPVHRRPIHLDFYALDMNQTVRVNIAIHYKGKAQGEREGGIFNALRRDVEVECLPTHIPDFFTINVENMQLGKVLHVSDLDLPGDVRLLTTGEEAIASVVAAKEKQEATTASESSPESGEAAPKAQGDKKPEEKKK